MNEKELMQTALRYQMSTGFLNSLLNDGNLKKDEFDVAAKYVAERYDIVAVEYALTKLRYPNLQTKEPILCKESVTESAVEKWKHPIFYSPILQRILAMRLRAMSFKAVCVAEAL